MILIRIWKDQQVVSYGPGPVVLIDRQIEGQISSRLRLLTSQFVPVWFSLRRLVRPKKKRKIKI